MQLVDDKASMIARARAAGCPVLDFDIEDGPEFRHDVRGMWARAREAGPLFLSSAGPGFWVATGHEVSRAICHDDRTFSNRHLEVFRRQPHVMPTMIPIQLDAPDHRKYRMILAGLFTPTQARRHEARFRAECAALFEALARRDRFDFITEVARPLPSGFALGLLGIPRDAVADVTAALIDATFLTHAEDPDGAIRQARAAMVGDMLVDLLARRRADPQDDWLSTIATAEVDGRPLDEDEMFRIAILLANAGAETTGGVMAGVFEHFARTPSARQVVAGDSPIPAAALQELLRVYAVTAVSRAVLRDTEFHGIALKRGDRVVTGLLPANHDPAVFADPEAVRLDRTPNPHMTFGQGPHSCLGSHLARMEIAVALEEWHRRIPAYRIADDFAPHYHVATTYSLSSLPLVLGES